MSKNYPFSYYNNPYHKPEYIIFIDELHNFITNISSSLPFSRYSVVI